MGLLTRLAGLFTKGARDDELLLQGLAHAKAKRPEEAIALYDRLVADRGAKGATRARALFNRALAHSALDNDGQAVADLEQVLKLPDLPENVQSAARTQLARVRRRNA